MIQVIGDSTDLWVHEVCLSPVVCVPQFARHVGHVGVVVDHVRGVRVAVLEKSQSHRV